MTEPSQELLEGHLLEYNSLVSRLSLLLASLQETIQLVSRPPV
jgi:hypothetical protein